jgi:hypothetical protein
MGRKTRLPEKQSSLVQDFTPRTTKQSEFVKLIRNHEVVIAKGSPGTGKTYCALAAALQLLGDEYKKIIIVKSVTTLPNEEIGFLKGSQSDKMEPFMMSFTWNIDKLCGEGAAKSLIEKGLLQVLPLAFVRGISIDNSIVVIDECLAGDVEVYVKSDKEISSYRNSVSKMKQLVKNFNSGKQIEILSHNDITGELEYKKLLNARSTGVKNILGITIQQRSVPIKCSANHPFAVYEKGEVKYIAAEELKVGDRLLLVKDGSNNHTIYNDNNLDIMLGFILGDGCISKNKQTTPDIYRLKKQHGMCQLKYCEFSSEILDTTVTFTGKSGYTGEVQPVTTTKSLYINPEFINTSFDKNNKKRVTEEMEKYFTERTLALWYMDDGSVNIYDNINANCVLHTEGFSYEENEVLASILLNKFNIKVGIGDYDKNGHTLYYLTLGKEATRILHNLIKELVHDSMQYKLIPEYRGFFDKSKYFKFKNLQNITTKLITDIENLGSEEVFNIEVEDNHNYFANGILTHNCQNFDVHTFKTMMTRIGEDSKYILLGDSEQIDRKRKNESCLDKVLDMFKDNPVVGTIEFTDDDCVRNPIIPKILETLRSNGY